MSELLPMHLPSHDVFMRDRKGWTTSRAVAERFGKRHDDVLKAIRSLECSDEFRLRNFAESSYDNDQNRSMPMCEMTRDGFSFLAMGFTGSAAARWKEHFIGLFNAMEQQIEITADFCETMLVSQRALNQSMVCLYEDHRAVKDDISEIKGQIIYLSTDVKQIHDRIDDVVPRRGFDVETKHKFDVTCIQCCNGECPICRMVRIYDDSGKPIPNVHTYEHWHGRNRNRPEDGIPACKSCNMNLEKPGYRREKWPRFVTFQQDLARIFSNKAQQLGPFL